jgi:hypothetical protein
MPRPTEQSAPAMPEHQPRRRYSLLVEALDPWPTRDDRQSGHPPAAAVPVDRRPAGLQRALLRWFGFKLIGPAVPVKPEEET